jgi:hypothetical protein
MVWKLSWENLSGSTLLNVPPNEKMYGPRLSPPLRKVVSMARTSERADSPVLTLPPPIPATVMPIAR